MDNIFAPPTPNELKLVASKRSQKKDIFAAPTPEELSALKTKKPEDDSLISLEGLKKGAIEAIPAAGSLIGGGLGFVSPVPDGRHCTARHRN